MAELKTAEQYVVDRLETKERELEDLKISYEAQLENLKIAHKVQLEVVLKELDDARAILNILREGLTVRDSSHFGTYLFFDTIVARDNPTEFDAAVAYFDLDLNKEDNEDE